MDRRNPGFYVFCVHCGKRIVGCIGKHGDWMHTGTRREHCEETRTLAEPDCGTEKQRRKERTRWRERRSTACTTS